MLEANSPRLSRCAVIGALCLSACAPAEQWRGSVEEIDGVVHVMNPAEPLWGTSEQGEPRLSLELEQVFGVDREPVEAILGNEYELYVGVDAAGNVYVLDGQASQLVAFDSGGTVLWRVGRQGEGPGEFFRPRQVAVGPNGTIVVVNRSGTHLALWGSDGNYVSSVSLTDPPLALAELRNPYLAGFTARDRLVIWSAMFGKTGSRIAVIDPFAPAKVQEFAWDQLPQVEMPRNVASEVSVIAAPDGKIMVGSGAGYQFRIYDVDGTVLRHVTRAVDYPVRSGFWEEGRGRGIADFGNVLAPMPLEPDYLLLCVTWVLNIRDPDAMALELAHAAQEGRRPPDIEIRSSFDLFDRDGRLLYSLTEDLGNLWGDGLWASTGRPQFIGPDNRLYTIAGDPFPQIRRYRVEVR